MASFFPGGQDTWVTKVDNVDTILAAHVNDLQNAAASIEIGGVSTQNIAYAASITPNVPAGQYVIVGALTGNITINAPTNALTGRQLTLRFTQDGTGGRTVTWNAIFKVANWTINTVANGVTEATFTYDGTNWFVASSPPTGILTALKKPWYDVSHPTFGATNASLNVGANAAIVQANADGGGVVFIGPGSWTCNTGPLFPLSGVVLTGAGIDVTIILANGALVGGTADLVRIVQAGPIGNYYTRVMIGNFTLDCSAQTAGNGMTLQGFVTLTTEAVRVIKAWGYGIVWGSVGGTTPYAQNALARRIYLEGCGRGAGNDSFGGGGIQGEILEDFFCLDAADGTNPGGTAWDNTNVTGCTVQRAFCRTVSSGLAGIGAVTTDFGAVGLVLRDIWVSGWGQGAQIGSSASGSAIDITIDGLHTQSVKRCGVLFNVTAGFGVQTFKIINCDFGTWDTSAGANPAIALDGGHNGVIKNNTFGAVTTAYAIKVRGDNGSTTLNPPTVVLICDNDLTRPTNKLWLQFVDPNGTVRYRHNEGVNPAGGGSGLANVGQAPPAVPASGVASTNATGSDCDVYISTGAGVTITVVQIGGTTVPGATAAQNSTIGPFRVGAAQSRAITYAGGTPTESWFGVN